MRAVVHGLQHWTEPPPGHTWRDEITTVRPQRGRSARVVGTGSQPLAGLAGGKVKGPSWLGLLAQDRNPP